VGRKRKAGKDQEEEENLPKKKITPQPTPPPKIGATFVPTLGLGIKQVSERTWIKRIFPKKKENLPSCRHVDGWYLYLSSKVKKRGARGVGQTGKGFASAKKINAHVRLSQKACILFIGDIGRKKGEPTCGKQTVPKREELRISA